MPFPWPAALPITTRSLDPLFLGLLAAFSEHPRQVDAGAYVQLAEDLAKMEGDGVRAQEHLVRDPLIRQALGDQIRHCAFGIGQAGPAGPGPVGMREMPAPDARRNSDVMEQARAASIAATPLGFSGLPSDIGAGVVYLASDESRFVTGIELVIDGGVMAG